MTKRVKSLSGRGTPAHADAKPIEFHPVFLASKPNGLGYTTSAHLNKTYVIKKNYIVHRFQPTTYFLTITVSLKLFLCTDLC